MEARNWRSLRVLVESSLFWVGDLAKEGAKGQVEYAVRPWSHPFRLPTSGFCRT